MLYGLIGEKLGHSYSPEIHRKIGDYPYLLKELRPDELEGFFRERSFSGINVTIPYKEVCIPYLDEITEGAKRIGAVNTVIRRGDKLIGDNTDFYGMRELIRHAEVTLAGKKVLILGTGGTSKTAFAVAESLGAREILTVSRFRKKDSITYCEALLNHRDAEILINATPVGMYPDEDAVPIDVVPFERLEAVIDAIYHPLRTELVLRAEERGIKAFGGLYMLAAQAVMASALFFDRQFDPAEADRVYRAVLREKEYLILTGGSALSRCAYGKCLAEKEGRPFSDAADALPGSVISVETVSRSLLRNGRIISAEVYSRDEV